MAGGPQVSSNGEIVRREKSRGDLVSIIQSLGSEIARAVPRSVLSPERFSRMTITAIRTTPLLAQCEPTSFLACMFASAQLGLEPNTPLQHAFLIPRRNNQKGIVECTFLLGYQGMRELAFRTGKITALYARPVFKGDRFVYVLGDEEKIEHEPLGEDRLSESALTHAYAIAKVSGGDPVREVLNKQQIEARRKRSASAKGPWSTDYSAMARKSAVRAIWASLPRSTEMVVAQHAEELVDSGKSIAHALIDTPAADALEKLGALPAPEERAIDAYGEVQDAEVEPARRRRHDPASGEVAPEDEPD